MERHEVINILDDDLAKTRKKCIEIIDEYKDNKLFNLLFDARHTLLTYQFTMAGIDMGDRYLPDFLMGFSHLYGYHIQDDGGVRYNKEALDKYNKLTIHKRTSVDRPSWFTTKERDGLGYLNGNGESEDEIYLVCIKYLKESYYWHIEFPSLKFKYGKLDNDLSKEDKNLINKYLL